MYKRSDTTKYFNQEFSRKYDKIKHIKNLELSWENRDKLIYSLTPMMRKIVYDRAKAISSHNIETIDIIGAGSEGLVRGVDVYISRAVNDGVVHTAKISSFVHFYINKYISNFVNESITLLTCSERSLDEALKQIPVPINFQDDSVQETSADHDDAERANNIIDLHYINNDMNVIDTLNCEHNFNDNKDSVMEIFKNVKKSDQKMLMYYFGVGVKEKMTISEIANHFGFDENRVSKRLKSTLETLKNSMTKKIQKDLDLISVLNHPEKLMDINFMN